MPGGVISGTHVDKFATAFWQKAIEKFGDNKLIFHEDSYTKLDQNIKVTCKDHGTFERSANGFLKSTTGCKKCVKGSRRTLPKTLDEFEKMAAIIHKDKYTYPHQTFNGIKNKVTITCATHGKFEQKAVDHLDGRGCRRCNLAVGTLRYTTESFISKAKEVHEGRNYDYSKTIFKSGHDDLIVTCPVHGDYSVEASSHIAGRECNNCRNYQSRMTTAQFINKAIEVHGDKYDYSKVDYIKNDEQVTIICQKHGEFQQRANGHLSGYGCKKCFPRNSKKAILWLELMRVRYDEHVQHADNGGEYYFPSAPEGKSRLDIRADGFSALSNRIFEFYGTTFHGDPRRYKASDSHWCIPKTYGELYQATLD